MDTIRSREISACIVLQAQSLLMALYKDHADTIIGNCVCMVFLGGKEKNAFDIEKFLDRKLKLKANDKVETYRLGKVDVA